LPTAEFGVAFSPPFPDWFVCGDFMKNLRQQYQKPVEHVVPTKYHLGEYQGHLHIGIEHVRVEDPILEGVHRKHDFSFCYSNCIIMCLLYLFLNLLSFLSREDSCQENFCRSVTKCC
jgi:hypothetical protein